MQEWIAYIFTILLKRLNKDAVNNRCVRVYFLDGNAKKKGWRRYEKKND